MARRAQELTGLVLVVLLSLVGAARPAAASPNLGSRLLSVADLAPGWALHPNSKPSHATGTVSACGKSTSLLFPQAVPRGQVQATFAPSGRDTPQMIETLGGTSALSGRMRTLLHRGLTCHKMRLSISGHTAVATIDPLRFSTPIPTSLALRIGVSLDGLGITFDVVYFDVDDVPGSFLYEAVSAPDPTEVATYAAEAIAKVQGRTVVAPTTPSDSPPKGTAV